MSGGRIAVVVVNFNSAELLRINLVAVHQQMTASTDPLLQDAAIVVVDNWHSDQARTEAQELCREQGWHCVPQDVNGGFGHGMNIGVSTARELGADLYLLLNPDAQIDAASVVELASVVDNDPMTLAGPVITRPDGTLWSDGHDLYLQDGNTLATRKRAAGETAVAPWLTGACLLISDALWRSVDGFAPDYFLYWEDVELSWRVRQLGGNVAVVRTAHAIHDEGATHRTHGRTGHSPTFIYYNVRNRLLFAARNLDRPGRARWARTSLPAARRMLLWSGRRAVLTNPRLIWAAARGTLAGLWMMRHHQVRRTHAPTTRPVRVLASFPEPRPTTNPYIVMLKDALQARDDVELHTFSWRRALTGRYDVFHAHWPEILVSGHSPLKTAVRQLFFVTMLAAFRARGTAIVRTVHNLELPQGISPKQEKLLRLFEARTELRIRVNDSTPIPNGPQATVPHGHYREWFDRYETRQSTSGRIAFVGLIRRYKAVDQLIKAFRETRDNPTATTLVVAGRPSTDQLATEMRTLAAGDDRITLNLRFLTDEELVSTVTGSELVVLPAPEMHNSGTVLMALSLGRPVLVPDNEVNRRLAEEVGTGWVNTFTGTLTGEHLDDALAACARRTPRPRLDARDWPHAAALHVAAYRNALRGDFPEDSDQTVTSVPVGVDKEPDAHTVKRTEGR
ncbi:Glycosyltransferase, GT2 family [Austwickia chelonae]|uniref:Putative glycosyltransferase n=1 Tax=Austwickia chelonae NBRC 105200 TaxID=1184607 RepID=K6V9Y7_9MICO|nr:glycosyltransferase [Austwickia chelonae]GAB79028.1 putative glycosyltransferase [Austwickia chelonae NBRC 105200]SEW41726.1 Glycosyltransferase, GT2 family [Austwickia chelonae]